VAWAPFCKACWGPRRDQGAVEDDWFHIIAELFFGKQPDELSPTE